MRFSLFSSTACHFKWPWLPTVQLTLAVKDLVGTFAFFSKIQATKQSVTEKGFYTHLWLETEHLKGWDGSSILCILQSNYHIYWMKNRESLKLSCVFLNYFPSFPECIRVILIFYFCGVQGEKFTEWIRYLMNGCTSNHSRNTEGKNQETFTHETHKKSLGICSRLKETKETWKLNTTWNPQLNPEFGGGGVRELQITQLGQLEKFECGQNVRRS